MSDNLANQYRPRNFKDYIGQEHYVNSIQDLIRHNRHHLAKCIWLTGPSGTGKSTLALLYARATLCLNRKEGEFEPCGTCDICLGKDESCIHHYTITNTTEARASISELSGISRQSPITRPGMREDQRRRFIIIDEAELASAELIAQLLDSTEHSPKTTTWIIISMDPQKLEKRDPVILEAIQSRCVELPLRSLSVQEIAENIKSKLEINNSAAYKVAELSKGNMRMALNTVGLLLVSWKAEDITEEMVIKYKVGDLSSDDIKKLWNALGESNVGVVNSILTRWESNITDKSVLANILLDSLLANIANTTEEGKNLIRSICNWQSSKNRYPLGASITPFLGSPIFKSTAKTSVVKHLFEAHLNNGRCPFTVIKSVKDLVSLK